jgi:hypothetical protein
VIPESKDLVMRVNRQRFYGSDRVHHRLRSALLALKSRCLSEMLSFLGMRVFSRSLS